MMILRRSTYGSAAVDVGRILVEDPKPPDENEKWAMEGSLVIPDRTADGRYVIVWFWVAET